MPEKKPARDGANAQSGDLKAKNPETLKTEKLKEFTVTGTDQPMTSNTNLKISDDVNSLKAGNRGPTLLEDFLLREKITHFDHERIPERVVHARGSAAHGVFKVYESQSALTKAGFLNDTSRETPVFVRFSTVAGSQGSTDLARDVRGFAVRFYTEEGNFDLVGNNMPVFFIQDAIKFPDLIHAVKPEPDNGIPQAASAHDTFWDFISLMPESAHMIMWVMSDRAIPRSLRMMEGFGVHTFRFITDAGKSSFVKFHWKPLLGVHSVAWDEAQNISGKDSDFHRRDLWNAIESGNFPEWELGVQIVAEEDEHKFEFDLLDATKLIPEELVPVQRIGKMTLNRNPDNFFAENEQVAFHLANIVPGIDFTDDPLLTGRLFSYLDTQLTRLGGPNFHQLPINRPLNTVTNNQRDGHSRQTIDKGKTSYHPNSLGGGCPYLSGKMEGGFESHPQRVEGVKIRERSKSFMDHFSQATLFFNSQSEPEKNHIIEALSFELGKVQTVAIRERMLRILKKIDTGLATEVAYALRLHIPKDEIMLNQDIPADADVNYYKSEEKKSSIASSPALSMFGTIKGTVKTRQVAILAADGADGNSLKKVRAELIKAGAVVEIIAPRQGYLVAENEEEIPVDKSFLNAASVLYDAVYVAGGVNSSATLAAHPDAVHFLNEAFKHCKAIAADDSALQVIESTYFFKKLPPGYDDGTVLREGLVMGSDPVELADKFIKAIGQHRFWEREPARKIPA